MKRVLTGLSIVATTLTLGACVGDTDPATRISTLSARLNLTGHADNGPAYSYFEYWKTSTPETKFTTELRTWAAGAQGSFGETVTGLTPATNYSFRACGGDSGDAPICMTTRSFTTLAGTSYAFDRKWGNGGTGDGQFRNPYGVATGPTGGGVFVGDCGNNRVQVFTSNGVFARKWGNGGTGDGQFRCAGDVAVNHSTGDVYVA